MNADKLIQSIQTELKQIDEKITQHPYMEALEQDRVKKEDLQHFAGHQYHIINSDLRSIAHLVSREASSVGREFLLGVLHGESAALKGIIAFSKTLGLTEEEMDSFEPQPEGFTYPAFVAWLGAYGSAAEMAAAFLVNFQAWGVNCGRMSKALNLKLNFKTEELRFFELFAQTPPEFQDQAMAVVSDGLARGISPHLIQRAARLLQGYELMFWDCMHSSLPQK
jgi:thiaminase